MDVYSWGFNLNNLGWICISWVYLGLMSILTSIGTLLRLAIYIDCVE
jgi:hypothetical protein